MQPILEIKVCYARSSWCSSELQAEMSSESSDITRGDFWDFSDTGPSGAKKKPPTKLFHV